MSKSYKSYFLVLSKVCLLLLFFVLVTSVIEGILPVEIAENQNAGEAIEKSTSAEANAVTSMPELANVVHGISTDDPYIQEYLRVRNSFRDVVFIPVTNNASVEMKSGNGVDEDIKGYTIQDKGYAIHLIICDEESKSCSFRINGVPTGKLVSAEETSTNWFLSLFGFNRESPSFALDDDYKLEIKSIKFNDCGNRRFCDIYWNEEDIVELGIKRR